MTVRIARLPTLCGELAYSRSLVMSRYNADRVMFAKFESAATTFGKLYVAYPLLAMASSSYSL